MRLPVVLMLVLVALASPGVEAAPKPAMTPEEASATRLAFERGKLIYAYDQAAWHGSDDFQAKVPDFASKTGGWIVDGPADAPQLVYFDRSQDDPHALYVARFRGREIESSKVLGEADDRVLSPERKALIAARRAAIDSLASSRFTQCKEQPFNSVVLPPDRPGGPTLVYILTPQTELKAIPLGGHYRVEVGPDGRAGKPKAFTNSCLEMNLADPKGGRPAALAVTHLLDPLPTEIHVFSAFAAGLPLFVATRDGRTWGVDGEGIILVDGKRRKGRR